MAGIKHKRPRGRPVGSKEAQPRRWSNTFYVKAYNLAKEGHSNVGIATALGINRKTLDTWMDENPAFREAITDGRTRAKNPNDNITKFINDRMPEHVRSLWKQISSFWESEDPKQRVDALLEGQSRRLKQHLFIHALVATNFNKHRACNMMNLRPPTIQAWSRDAKFQQLVGCIVEMKKDFVEGCLLDLIAGGDSPATIFAAKTLLRDRGYDPKITVEHKGGVLHGHFSLEQLLRKLDVASQKKILAAIRQKETPKALPAHTEPEDVQDAEWEEVEE